MDKNIIHYRKKLIHKLENNIDEMNEIEYWNKDTERTADLEEYIQNVMSPGGLIAIAFNDDFIQ